MNHDIILYNRGDLERRIKTRQGEAKLGEKIKCLKENETLDALPAYREKGTGFALLGIPESIGIKANLGKSGAEKAWEVFLDFFLNMQGNRFLTGESILCLGHVDTDSLNRQAANVRADDPDGLKTLRGLCARLDDMVHPVITRIVTAGMIPVVIGGGHNNAFPILKGITLARNAPRGINCVNCDPHADYRPLEGRHSGNAFSYAHAQGYLDRYFIFGLHAAYNSTFIIDKIENDPRTAFNRFETFEPFHSRINRVAEFFENSSLPVGIELDMDSIAWMPASAMTPCGWRVAEARRFIVEMCRRFETAYLHLPEAAPDENPRDTVFVGKTLAYLVSDFIEANLNKAAMK